jgi:hypothetical protein
VDLPKSLAGNHLLRLARRAYQRTAEDPDDCEVVIILSAIALEATVHELQFMGEFFAQCNPPEGAPLLADLLQRAEEERAAVTFKLELAYLAFTGHLPVRGTQPYQDVDLLLRLRNLLVHPRPETVSYGGRPDGVELPKIVRSFGSRGIIPMPGADANLGWREHVLVKPVAAWAFNTVVRAMRWLAGACPHEGIRTVWTVRADEFAEL